MLAWIPADIYIGVYYSILSIFVLFFVYESYYFSNINLNKGRSESTRGNEPGVIILFLFVLIIMGLRPMYGLFTDMRLYRAIFFDYVNNPDNLMWEEDFVFDKYNRILAITKSEVIFFFVTALIYVYGVYRFSLRVFGWYKYPAFLMAVTSMSFFAYGVNTIRAGMAASIVLIGISYLGNLKKAIPLFFLAIGIHTSMFLPVVSISTAYFFHKTKITLFLWGGAILLSSIFGGIFEAFFSSLGFDDNRLEGYLLGEKIEDHFAYSGFRWDFLLYSAIPVIMGWYVVIKRGFSDKFYLVLLNSYLIANSFWVLVIRANFSDRFAYLSWFMMPFVIIYPLLKFPIWKRQYAKVGMAVFLNFLFTLAIFLLRS